MADNVAVTAGSGTTIGAKEVTDSVLGTVKLQVVMAQSRPSRTVTVTIANGASLSGAADLGGGRIVGIEMPAAWTAANLTFQSSDAVGGTYQDLYDSANLERNISVAASRNYALDPGSWIGAPYLKVRSGTSGTPVNQGGSRDIVLIVQD